MGKTLVFADARDVSHYGISLNSGIMAAGLAAASEIIQFRWAPTTTGKKALLHSITFSAANNGTAFAAGACLFELVRASAWTVAGSGGNAAVLTGINAKYNTGIGGSEAAFNTSSTAALTAGTKTLADQPTEAVFGAGTTTAGQIIIPLTTLYLEDDDLETPHTFAANEGFVIRATVPATGTWKFAANIRWFETK